MQLPKRGLTRAGIATAAILGVLFFTLPLTLPGSLRTRLARALGERFGGSVDVQALRVSVFPRLRIAGEGVVVQRRGDVANGPPLIRIKAFSGEAGLLGLLGSRLHIREVRLTGLEINVPPGGVDITPDKDSGDSDGQAAARPSTSPAASEATSKSPLVVDDVIAEDAMLRILRREPEKKPREFAIAHLAMHDTGADIPWAFTASLTNPTPPGRIDTQGTFGPWNADRPAQTALAASFTFKDADLGVFDGISGTLQASGKYSGVLERIEVDGNANVKDFALDSGGHPMALDTTFHSIVDGTNGNTWLQPVDATFGDTSVHAEGGVVEKAGQDGRTVALDIAMDRARLEDVLRLAVDEDTPAMTGGLKLRAKFELPPGHVDAMQKLLLNGSFQIDDARFTSGGIQAKVNDLSQKAQADKGPPEEVLSDFSGKFTMSGGVIRFSTVTFSMPGAHVTLAGSYAGKTQALDFRGTVRMEAKLSQMTSGFKSALLKVIEPVFRHKGATVIPITIGGTAKEPKFGLDVARAFTPR